MKNTAQYPYKIFDGCSTGNPSRNSRFDDINPTARDYDQLAAEIIATQTKLNSSGIVDPTWYEQVENNSGVDVQIGQVVCLKSNGKFTLAHANNITTSEVLGLVADEIISNGNIGTIQLMGSLDSTTVKWDAITNQSGGLTPNSIYYLSVDTPGKLSITPTTIDNTCLVRVGKALSPVTLLIYPQEPILL
ncbi:MAG: hypothetical protein WC315_00020 [Candidatus Omnitrophota bacterium]|jgi:hypothetical protein